MIIKSATNETISIRRVIISLRRYKRRALHNNNLMTEKATKQQQDRDFGGILGSEDKMEEGDNLEHREQPRRHDVGR
jgi:hypothetical protein